jgi:transposase-like protein
MLAEFTIQEFRNRFTSDAICMEYLVTQKWGEGYQCIKCGCIDWTKGRQWFYRRCKDCKYDESATCNTLFHGAKLSLLKVFELAYRISQRKKGMSSCELSKELGCQQKTAWQWKAKFQKAMKSSEAFDLMGDVDVDEFVVGGLEEGKPGRSHGKKGLVVVGVEKVINKKGETTIGRAYARVIEKSDAKNLSEIFEKHIDKEALITTDGWSGYAPLKKDRNITQIPSNKGESMKLLHIHIMNVKGWLRGIHHKCSKERLQHFLDEYHFRFNRRGKGKNILDKLLVRAVHSSPNPYAALTTICEPST